ncbi:hypothetical protein EUGRSUZ_L00102 [Eucalyptus grandis]|uniref:Uncharacterized protein n=2 Tax=Eucalyptus grandis TaxID=71139 RepID=A0ACC3L4U6_EUCGR|nr:hypothetical protein EUGRSUZ_L00102 [Eucalyptus grandis]
MHLALHQKHYHIARALMSLNPELIRVPGERGKSEKENMDLLELLVEFLSACKSSIEDLTSQCKTAVHIAVRTGNIGAFKVLLGWLKRARLTQILNWKDQDGNTVLHMAAFERKSKIIDLLLGYMDVNENIFQGHTALEIFELNPSGSPDIAKRFRSAGRPKRLITPNLSLSEFFSRELSVSEKCANLYRVPDESARNAILVVSTLTAAATFQAALSPPGGYWQDSSSNPPPNSTTIAANSSSIALEKPHQAGEIILSGLKLYVYEICNSLAFFISILTIWVTTFTCFRYVFFHPNSQKQ